MPHGTVDKDGFLTESQHLFYLNLKQPGDPRDHYERLARGFMSFEPEMNEELDQTGYLDGGGFATTTMMGGQATISFGGHRYYGDPVQDWIFEHQFLIGKNRETDFIWVQPTGNVIQGPVTIATVTGPSGDANAKGEIEVEIHYNGQPDESLIPAPTDLVATSVTDTSVDIEWGAVEYGDASVTYDVYQNGVLVAEGIEETTYSATDLFEGEEYLFFVITRTELAEGIEAESAPSETLITNTTTS